MSKTPRTRILIVDDDLDIREMLTALLTEQGHEISTAEDGFDALLQMKTAIPQLVISDLNMPRMSGFEFMSVLRRRFPQVLVIAMSGAYEAGDVVPGGIIADAFYAKGPTAKLNTIQELVREVLRSSASLAKGHIKQSAPVWVPRNGKDARGVPYIVLTCTDCLRSFPINVATEVSTAVMETPCIFCLNSVRYIIDFSLTVASPDKKLGVATVEGVGVADRSRSG